MHTHEKGKWDVTWLVLVTLVECHGAGAENPCGMVLLPSQLRGTARDPSQMTDIRYLSHTLPVSILEGQMT